MGNTSPESAARWDRGQRRSERRLNGNTRAAARSCILQEPGRAVKPWFRRLLRIPCPRPSCQHRPSGEALQVNTTNTCSPMARPPQYPMSEPDSLAVAKAKTALKELSPEGRAFVIAWLLKYYSDNGMMYSPSITQERRRITIDGEEFWLARAPKRR
jgi:hypothetical protein